MTTRPSNVRDKYPGYTHIALRVASIPETVAALSENGIPIAQGPVSFGKSGQISVFVRDLDRNVIELRGREQAGSCCSAWLGRWLRADIRLRSCRLHRFPKPPRW
jgi:hypothetical protein